jgi:hypothetical protein
MNSAACVVSSIPYSEMETGETCTSTDLPTRATVLPSHRSRVGNWIHKDRELRKVDCGEHVYLRNSPTAITERESSVVDTMPMSKPGVDVTNGPQ